MAAEPDRCLGFPPSLVLLCRNVPRVAGLKSQSWIGSRDYWARSPVTVQGVAVFPWKGWLSVQLCRGGGCESLQGSLPACELPPAKMGTCTGPGPGHISTGQKGAAQDPLWLLANCPPNSDGGEGGSH